ncbi:MAG: dTDP-4-dehydrorhamnose reductase [Tissierellia bacterium]|nr:dTDP-4-dehydrorhamnose reductase [Tissierellia bacterium]
MSKILITGVKGQLGKELIRQLKNNKEYTLLLTDVDDLDITNIDSVNIMLKAEKPNIVINCAAHTAVDKCETDVDNAYKINAIGARNLAIASNEIGSKIVHISTDYVFNGIGNTDLEGNIIPYTEFDTPEPQTVYGKTKLQGENFVKNTNPRHFIIRTAWLYGEGNNFVHTMIKLGSQNESVKVVNDQYGTPTSTEELAKMIIYLMETDNYGLFHGTCEGQCTWYEFAKEIFKLKGMTTEVIPVTTEEFPRPAKRPKYSVLDNYMLRLTSDFRFGDWKEALVKYLTHA